MCCYFTWGYYPSKSYVLGFPVCVIHLCHLPSSLGFQRSRSQKGSPFMETLTTQEAYTLVTISHTWKLNLNTCIIEFWHGKGGHKI
jgi:hypothetical protein